MASSTGLLFWKQPEVTHLQLTAACLTCVIAAVFENHVIPGESKSGWMCFYLFEEIHRVWFFSIKVIHSSTFWQDRSDLHPDTVSLNSNVRSSCFVTNKLQIICNWLSVLVGLSIILFMCEPLATYCTNLSMRCISIQQPCNHSQPTGIYWVGCAPLGLLVLMRPHMVGGEGASAEKTLSSPQDIRGGSKKTNTEKKTEAFK